MKVAAMFGGEMYRLEKDEIDGGTSHFGAYAEPFTGDGLRSRTQYVIAHRGTGGCVAIVRSKDAAVRLMNMLESLPVDWGFRKKQSAKHEAAWQALATLPKAERRKLKPVYDAANNKLK